MLKVKAQAKINLALDVLNERDDGYHNVKMVMQTIDLADQLIFYRQEQGIDIKVNLPELSTGPENLVYQAVELLAEEFDITAGVKVEIKKNIPLAAGLAGGSADAAASLWAVNKLWDLGLTPKELRVRGAQLGADVPFCLWGGTKLATGIGTDLAELPAVPDLDLVVVNPPYKISTPEVYSHFSGSRNELAADKLLSALQQQDKQQIISYLSNDLGQIATDLYPELAELKEKVDELTSKAIISGSGPTVLGVVSNKQTAEEVTAELKQKLTSDYQITAAKTVDYSLKTENISLQ